MAFGLLSAAFLFFLFWIAFFVASLLGRRLVGERLRARVSKLLAKLLAEHPSVRGIDSKIEESRQYLVKRDGALETFRKDWLARADAIVEAERRLASMETSLAVKGGEASDLKALLAEKTDLATELSRKLGSLHPVLDRKEEQLADAKRRLPELDSGLNLREKRVSAAEKDLARLNESREKLAAELAKMRDLLKKLEGQAGPAGAEDAEALGDALRRLQAQLDQAERDASHAEEALRREEANEKNLKRGKDRLSKAMQTTETRGVELEENFRREQEARELEMLRDDLGRELDDLRGQLERWKRETVESGDQVKLIRSRLGFVVETLSD